MRHFARFARLYHYAHFRANALAYQMMMHTRDGKQAGYGRVVSVNAPVGQDDNRVALGNRLVCFVAYPLNRAR